MDLTGCKGSPDIHDRIQEAFDFPEWYGKHWDAFWDLFFPTRDNTIVEISGVATLPEETGKHMEILLRMLQENKDKMDELKYLKPEFDCRFNYRVID